VATTVFLCDLFVGSSVMKPSVSKTHVFSCSILGYSGNQSKGTSSETRTGKILTLHTL